MPRRARRYAPYELPGSVLQFPANYAPLRHKKSATEAPADVSTHFDIGDAPSAFAFTPNYDKTAQERPQQLTVSTLADGTQVAPRKNAIVDNQVWSKQPREHLEKVAPHLPQPPFLFSLIGPFNSGKTTRLSTMLAYYAHPECFKVIDIISPTAARDPVWLQAIYERHPGVEINVHEQMPWEKLREREKKCLEFYRPYIHKAMIGQYKEAQHENSKLWQLNRPFDDPSDPFRNPDGSLHDRVPHLPLYPKMRLTMLDAANLAQSRRTIAQPRIVSDKGYNPAMLDVAVGHHWSKSKIQPFRKPLQDPRTEIQELMLRAHELKTPAMSAKTLGPLAVKKFGNDDEFNKVAHLIIIDDMVGLIHGDELIAFNRLMSILRHCQTAVCCCAQKLKGGMGTFVRANSTHAAISNVPNRKEMDDLKSAFGTSIPHFEAAYDAAMAVTDPEDPAQKYNFLYLNLTSKPPRLYRNFAQRILLDGFDPDYAEQSGAGLQIDPRVASEPSKLIPGGQKRGRLTKAALRETAKTSSRSSSGARPEAK